MINLNRSAAKAGFWFVICNIIQRGIQFLYTPIYSRLLSTDGYGKYSTFLAWESILAVFATLNLCNAVFNKGMVKYDSDGDGFAYSMYGLSAGTCTITFIICLGIYFFFNPIFKLSLVELVLLSVVMYFKMVIQLWSAKERYNFKYKALLLITIISSLLNPIVSIILFRFYRNDYLSIEIGYAVSMFVVGIILIIATRSSQIHLYNATYWKYAFLFVLPLIPHYLSNVILYQSDRLMIGYYFDDASVGIYTLAYQLSLATSVVFTAVNNALVPWLYRKIKCIDYKLISGVVMAMISVVLIVSLALILVAPELIYILGSSAFMPATNLVAPIVVSTVLMFVNTLVLDVLFYYEKNKTIMIATVSGAVTNLVLNYLLIPREGYGIAAYTTVIGYAVILIMNFIDLIHIKTPFKYINHKSIMILIMGILSCFLSQYAFAWPVFIRWLLTLGLCAGSLVIFYKRYYIRLKTEKGED